MSATVHVVEPGGRGGVYQHAAALAGGLVQAGVRVVVHTAADAEDVPLPGGVSRRACFWRFSGVRPRSLRRLAVLAGWLVAGVPRLLASARPGDVIHVEGRVRPILLPPLVLGARLRRCVLGFNPHTTFSRRSSATEDRVVRWVARRADVVFALSEHGRAAVESWGPRPVPVSLAVIDEARKPDPARVEAWRRRWGPTGRPIVLLAGQLRPDKGLDLAVVAAAQWGDALLAVVGEDHGTLAAALEDAEKRGVGLLVDEGYQLLPDLVAAVAAADAVICPYRVASTSAVLALASALGRPTVATDVGGLAELATVTVSPDDPGPLARGVEKALAVGSVPPSWPANVDVARGYLGAYGLTGTS